MGIVYNTLKEYQKAIDAYKEAIKIKPDYHEAYYNMGVAYKAFSKL
jgi:tetratricopeptide (TPR) repeat protein